MATSPDDRQTTRRLPVWAESVVLLAVALVLAVVVKAFFIQAFYIPSESMEPGLQVNDRILVEKVSGWGDPTPHRRDVVVFEDSGGWLKEDAARAPNALARTLSAIGLYPEGGHLVKRVIGLPGDTIVCCDAKGRLSVNGRPQEEPYVAKDAGCAAPMVECRLRVGPIPDGYVFVMGDNRAHSGDSTVHLCAPAEDDCPPTRGLVPIADIVGRAWMLVWPLGRFHTL